MTKYTSLATRTNITLVVVVTVLFSYNFLSAWTAAPASPPANNAPAPLNVSVNNQTKIGNIAIKNLAPQLELDDTDTDNHKWWLNSNGYDTNSDGFNEPHFNLLYDRSGDGSWGADDGYGALFVTPGGNTNGTGDLIETKGSIYAPTLAAGSGVRSNKYCDGTASNCALSVGGTGRDMMLESNSPTVFLNDWNDRNFFLHANDKSFYILGDRDDNANIDATDYSTGGWPMQLFVGANSSEDYTKFSNQVRAKSYCDENGRNCKNASGVATTDYVTYATNYCGLNTPSPGGTSINGVRLMTGHYYDIYDSNGGYAGLEWGCFGPDAAANYEITKGCGFDGVNASTVTLDTVQTSDGGIHDLFDKNSAHTVLYWTCRSPKPEVNAIATSCGLKASAGGGINGVIDRYGVFYDFYDTLGYSANLYWACN